LFFLFFEKKGKIYGCETTSTIAKSKIVYLTLSIICIEGKDVNNKNYYNKFIY